MQARGGHAQGRRQGVHAQPQGDQRVFAQNLARMDGAQAVGGGHVEASSVIAQDFHVIRIAIKPDQAEAPLVIDAQAVLSGAFADPCASQPPGGPPASPPRPLGAAPPARAGS